MPIREELSELLSKVKTDCSEKYTQFAKKDGFNEDQFIEFTVKLFRAINDFRRRFLILDNIPIGDSLLQNCKEKIEALATDNAETFKDNGESLAKFLDNFLLPAHSTLEMIGSLNETTPINRRVIDEQLSPQSGIIDQKKIDIVEDGGPFDEAEFQKINGELTFSRKVYWQQLLKNIVQADLDDYFDIRDSNTDIKNASADNFLQRLKDAQSMIDSKIKPRFA